MERDLALVIDRLDTAEALAYRDMFTAAPAPLARSLWLEARKMAGATLLIAQLAERGYAPPGRCAGAHSRLNFAALS
jgi:hypothetical protein